MLDEAFNDLLITLDAITAIVASILLAVGVHRHRRDRRKG